MPRKLSQRLSARRWGVAWGISLAIHFMMGGFGLVWLLNAKIGGSPEVSEFTLHIVSVSSPAPTDHDAHSGEVEEQNSHALGPSSNDAIAAVPEATNPYRADILFEGSRDTTAPPARVDQEKKTRASRKVSRHAQNTSEPLDRSSAKSMVRDHPLLGQVPNIGVVTPPDSVIQPKVRTVEATYREVLPDYGWLTDTVKHRLDRIKRYPPAARSRGWHGKVVLLATLTSSGEVESVTVEQSSGHPVIDEDARNLMWKISPVPLRYPIEEKEVLIQVPLKYELN